jgi:hypothetical protein
MVRWTAAGQLPPCSAHGIGITTRRTRRDANSGLMGRGRRQLPLACSEFDQWTPFPAAARPSHALRRRRSRRSCAGRPQNLRTGEDVGVVVLSTGRVLPSAVGLTMPAGDEGWPCCQHGFTSPYHREG